jgi:lysosomal alpha-mannosidase
MCLILQGYDGLFFGRLDHEDKKERMAKKTMEMVWSGSDSLGKIGVISIIWI